MLPTFAQILGEAGIIIADLGNRNRLAALRGHTTIDHGADALHTFQVEREH
ncbi:MAG: hypothetical protein AABN95_16905 [Acidobacteriota bacterium]